jgi:MFS family permease
LARNNDAVVLVVVMGLAQHFAGQAPSMQWQPFLHQHLPRERELGMVFAGSMFLQFIGTWLAPRFSRFVKNERKMLALTQIFFGAGIAFTTLWSSLPLILLFFGLHQVARGMYVPLKDTYLNHHIPSAERATYISFEAQSHHLGGMAGLLVAGLLGQYVSMSCAWIIMGVIVVVSGIKHLRRPTT